MSGAGIRAPSLPIASYGRDMDGFADALQADALPAEVMPIESISAEVIERHPSFTLRDNEPCAVITVTSCSIGVQCNLRSVTFGESPVVV